MLFLTIEVFIGNLVEAAFNALNAKLVFKPVNSKSMLYFLTKHAQYAVEPLPLPILISDGLAEIGICGNFLIHKIPKRLVVRRIIFLVASN